MEGVVTLLGAGACCRVAVLFAVLPRFFRFPSIVLWSILIYDASSDIDINVDKALLALSTIPP